jgi:hypothetical protein
MKIYPPVNVNCRTEINENIIQIQYKGIEENIFKRWIGLNKENADDKTEYISFVNNPIRFAYVNRKPVFCMKLIIIKRDAIFSEH